VAARKRLAHRESTKVNIRTSMLINRLQGFALNENDPQSDRPIEMSGEQVRAALGLIKKTTPDKTENNNNVNLVGKIQVELVKLD
jgi:hypothetical protein